MRGAAGPLEWLTFRSPDDIDKQFRVNVSFMLSNYNCIWGRGCPGLLNHHHESEVACCELGVRFMDADDFNHFVVRTNGTNDTWTTADDFTLATHAHAAAFGLGGASRVFAVGAAVAMSAPDFTTSHWVTRVVDPNTNMWSTADDFAPSPTATSEAHAIYEDTVGSLLVVGSTRDGTAPSQRELADLTGLDAIYVSKLVRALELSGLVIRPTHDRDPRARALSLTPQGVQTITAAIEAVRDLQGRLTRTLGGPRSKRTRDFTDTLRALLDDPEGEPS